MVVPPGNCQKLLQQVILLQNALALAIDESHADPEASYDGLAFQLQCTREDLGFVRTGQVRGSDGDKGR